MIEPSKKKTRRYSEAFLTFRFIPSPKNDCAPFCLLCQQTLSNDSMKTTRLETHFRARHSDKVDTSLMEFKRMREIFEKRTTITTLFTASNRTATRVQEASYRISLLIAKAGQSHCIGEKLIKPAISEFLKTGTRQLGRGDNSASATTRLLRQLGFCNNSASATTRPRGQLGFCDSSAPATARPRVYSKEGKDGTDRWIPGVQLTPSSWMFFEKL